MSSRKLYEMLVDPVCALEEVCINSEQSAMVNVISVALRKILNDIEEDMYKDDKVGVGKR